MAYAPILLFTYKRLNTLKNTVTALQQNYLAKESDLFIFSDGVLNIEDKGVIDEVRLYLRTIYGFKTIKIFEEEKNKGLANSIIDGVTQIINLYGKVIVIEDDLYTTPNFLHFMNQALIEFENCDKVFSISGYNYNFKLKKKVPYDNYFGSRTCSWGWASWNDRWSNLNWDINTYSEIETSNFKQSFNKSGSDLLNMLLLQKNNKINSWAIRWYYNQWKQGKLTVYPILSLVQNNGFDNLATHTHVFNRFTSDLMPISKLKFNFNLEITLDLYYQKLIQRKYSILNRFFWGKIIGVLNKFYLLLKK